MHVALSTGELSSGAGRPECHLLSTLAIQSVAGTQVPVKFELADLPLQTLNLGFSLLQFIVSWLHWNLALQPLSDLIGLSANDFFRVLLSREFGR